MPFSCLNGNSDAVFTVKNVKVNADFSNALN